MALIFSFVPELLLTGEGGSIFPTVTIVDSSLAHCIPDRGNGATEDQVDKTTGCSLENTQYSRLAVRILKGDTYRVTVKASNAPSLSLLYVYSIFAWSDFEVHKLYTYK